MLNSRFWLVVNPCEFCLYSINLLFVSTVNCFILYFVTVDRDKWHIIEADRIGIAPKHTANRYYGNSFVRCNNCRDLGHLAANCPKPNVSSPSS